MDIVVTIPKSEYANDDLETKEFLENEGSLQFWVLGSYPRQLCFGDRVYFVKHGKVESSMQVVDIRQDAEQKCDTTGRVWKGRTFIYMGDLQFYQESVEVNGFRGFRYRWW